MGVEGSTLDGKSGTKPAPKATAGAAGAAAAAGAGDFKEPKAMNVETQQTPRFAADDPKAYEYMREHGYAVIKDALGAAGDGSAADEAKSNAAVTEARELLWQFLESAGAPKLKRFQPDTWHEAWPGGQTVGIVASHSVGHSAFLWFVRRQPQVRRVFARVWGCDEKELLTSFDGCGIFRPWNVHAPWKTFGSWFHVDQNPRRKAGLHAVQGLVSLYDQDHTTGGLVVIPGTHLRQAKLLDGCCPPALKNDFVPIPKNHPELERRAVLVDCKAGDLVLWDSRTIHCNSPALTEAHRDTAIAGADGKQHELLRVAAYVCMTPLRMCTEPDTIIPQRVKAFARRQTTSHWPHEFRPTEDGTDPNAPNAPRPVELTDDEYLMVTGGWKPQPKSPKAADPNAPKVDGKPVAPLTP